jgi:tetratricopeptide (TPR) repeat protein
MLGGYMFVERLDLNIHTIEEIPGKIVELSGAEYIFQALLAEGGERFVYPIKNKKSGLILYLAKIHKFKPGSPESQRSITTLPKKLFDLVPPGLLLYTEFHDIPGAVIDLQPYGLQDNPEYCKDLMESAHNLHNQKKWVEAVEAYDEVLKVNPFHSMAMLNKAICLVSSREISEAIGLTQRAIEIEPNLPESYRILSSVILQTGRPEAAIEALMRTLNRFNCDPKTWETLLNIAVDYDLVDIAEEAIQEVNRLGKNPKPFEHFQDLINKSRLRKKIYDELLAKAQEKQRKGSWPEALELCSSAIRSSKNHSWAMLNYFVCKYHLGDSREIVDDLLSRLSLWSGPALASAVSLGMLCCDLAGNFQVAKKLALWVSSNYSHPVDIPGIPIVIYDITAVIEERSAQPIIDVLNSIEAICSENEIEQIITVKKLYEIREKDFRQD